MQLMSNPSRKVTMDSSPCDFLYCTESRISGSELCEGHEAQRQEGVYRHLHPLAPPALPAEGSGVYLLECPDGRIYVGKAVDITDRLKFHAKAARRGEGHGLLKDAFAEHPSGWRYCVLEEVTGNPDDLSRAEAHWFDALRPTLNQQSLDISRWWA